MEGVWLDVTPDYSDSLLLSSELAAELTPANSDDRGCQAPGRSALQHASTEKNIYVQGVVGGGYSSRQVSTYHQEGL